MVCSDLRYVYDTTCVSKPSVPRRLITKAVVAGVLATGQAGRMSGSLPDRSFLTHEHEECYGSSHQAHPVVG